MSSKVSYLCCYARWSHTATQRARLATALGSRLTPSATTALHHSLSRRDTCARATCEMPGIDAAGRTAQYYRTCGRVSYDFLPPRRQWVHTRTLPGTTQAEAYAGDKRLSAECRTAGAGLHDTRRVLVPARTGEDSRAGAGAAPEPHPLVKGYMQVQFEVPARESMRCGSTRVLTFFWR